MDKTRGCEAKDLIMMVTTLGACSCNITWCSSPGQEMCWSANVTVQSPLAPSGSSHLTPTNWPQRDFTKKKFKTYLIGFSFKRFTGFNLGRGLQLSNFHSQADLLHNLPENNFFIVKPWARCWISYQEFGFLLIGVSAFNTGCFFSRISASRWWRVGPAIFMVLPEVLMISRQLSVLLGILVNLASAYGESKGKFDDRWPSSRSKWRDSQGRGCSIGTFY